MADRRMFSKNVIDSDMFLDMPLSTQCLYFHLAMRADDDGFINNPKKIMRMIGASDDDMRVLMAKQFILTFESGVIVIRHWRMHNYIQKDRYKQTIYLDEKALLTSDNNNVYSLDTGCIQDVSRLDTQVRIGKERDRDSSDKEIKDKKKESFDDILNLVNGITDELKDAYLEFIKMRKLIKKPLTNYALKNIIKKVDEYSNGDIQIMIAILNQSIVNSWQGVFPLKNPTPSAPKTKISVPDGDDDDFKLPFEV